MNQTLNTPSSPKTKNNPAPAIPSVSAGKYVPPHKTSSTNLSTVPSASSVNSNNYKASTASLNNSFKSFGIKQTSYFGSGTNRSKLDCIGSWTDNQHFVAERNLKVEAEIFKVNSHLKQPLKDEDNKGATTAPTEEIPVTVRGSNPPTPVNDFEDCKDLHPLLLENIKLAKYDKPTHIQKYTISSGTNNRDLVACAHTGSGKTAGFLIPVLSQLFNHGPADVIPPSKSQYINTVKPFFLILAPTRELAIQIYDESLKFCYRSWVRPGVVYGGIKINEQFMELTQRKRIGCDLLIATPGRLVDMIERQMVDLVHVRSLVLDEADRMLDMGFRPQIANIIENNLRDNDERQTFMFSATFPKQIETLAKLYLKSDYLHINIGLQGHISKKIIQTLEYVEEKDKAELLMDTLDKTHAAEKQLVLIFTETKRTCEYLKNLLIEKNYRSGAIHGDRTQEERNMALKSFREGSVPILVATAVAARGLDIPNVSHVINYDLPGDVDDYIHRIGRTGRAGNSGVTTSFFNRNNSNILKDLKKILVKSDQQVPAWMDSAIDEQNSSSYSRTQNGRGYSNNYRGRGNNRGSYGGNNRERYGQQSSNSGDKW